MRMSVATTANSGTRIPPPGDRNRARFWATQMALEMVRRRIRISGLVFLNFEFEIKNWR